MWNGNDEFIVNGHQKCIHVHINGNFENGKVLYMEPDWSLQELLNAASHRLNLVPTAVRIFSPDGVEIDDCMMIEDNDILFFSTGSNFISLAYNDGDSRGEDLPKSIGGYKVGSFLGKGGFGEVRVGEHQLTGEKVAMKFISKRHFFNIDAAERTAIEIQCLNTLKHENIIRFLQHLEAPAHVVLVFELMSGGDLYNYMRKKVGTAAEVALGEDEARHVFQQVLSAVGYAHNQHICHRDLKLENILLKGPTPQHVKIADFGLSDFYRPGALVKTSCGTLSFLAPEVFRGTSNAGPPVDVWAMGVILFSLLCGRLPFEGTDMIGSKRPREDVIRNRILKCQYKIDDGLSPEAKDLVRRMLRLDPAERATIPELFNHCWLRSSQTSVVDFSARERACVLEESMKAITTGIANRVQLAPLPSNSEDKDKIIQKSSNDENEEGETSPSPSLSPRLGPLPAPTSSLSPLSSGFPVDGGGDAFPVSKPPLIPTGSSTSLLSFSSEQDTDIIMPSEELDNVPVLDDASVATNQKFRLVPLRRQVSQVPVDLSPSISRVNSSADLQGYPTPLNIRARQALNYSATLDESSFMADFILDSQNSNGVRSQTARSIKTSEQSESIRKNNLEVISMKGVRKNSESSEVSGIRDSSRSPRIERKPSSISLAGASSLKPSGVKKRSDSDDDDMLKTVFRNDVNQSQASPSMNSHYAVLPRKPQIPKQTRSPPQNDTTQGVLEKTVKASIPRVNSMSLSKNGRY